jgi:hypothetical protein
MDKFQRKLRLLIVGGSTLGFLGGWGLLAHAGKPATANSSNLSVPDAIVAPVQLPPLNFQSLESSSGSSNLQSLPVVPNTSFRPRMRTRSS